MIDSIQFLIFIPILTSYRIVEVVKKYLLILPWLDVDRTTEKW